MSKAKYYCVWKGFQTGVFKSWEDCQNQTKGYEGAQYKAFNTSQEAEHALSKNYWDFVNKSSSTKLKDQISKQTNNSSIVANSICVDAACSGNPGRMEYRCVDTITKKEIFASPVYEEGTNNIGEFLGLVHALALCKKKKVNPLIYTDSKTAISWVRNKKVKTTLTISNKNKEIFELIDRAILWLTKNDFTNEIVKWETEKWGEIPADYGRK